MGCDRCHGGGVILGAKACPCSPLPSPRSEPLALFDALVQAEVNGRRVAKEHGVASAEYRAALRTAAGASAAILNAASERAGQILAEEA